MSNFTITLGTFLKSHFVDDFGLPNGFGTNNNDELGNFNHANDVINQCFEKVFEKMNLVQDVHIDIKKAICVRFYNSEIGQETFARFSLVLQDKLNTKCFNLIKFYNIVKELELEEAERTSSTTSEGGAKTDTVNLQDNAPKENLNIVPDFEGIIRYAEAIAEQHGKNNYTNQTTGSNTMPKYQLYHMFSMLPSILDMICNICDKCFMQVY